MRNWMLALVVVLVAPLAAVAQPNLMVVVDRGTEYSNIHDVIVGVAFDVVVAVDSGDLEVSGAEFGFAGLEPLAPGIFRLETAYPSSPPGFSLEVPSDGIYRLDFGGCAAPCETRELLRITYGDFSGAVGIDEVVTVQGVVGPESSPTLRDCEGGVHDAPMGGTDGGVTYGGVVFPDGSLVFNPVPLVIGAGLRADGSARRSIPYANCDAVVDTADESLTLLKSRYLR